MKIVKKDYTSDKLQIIWTILFMLYMGLSTSVVINVQFEHLDEYNNPFVDFIMVLFAPFVTASPPAAAMMPA